LCDSIHEALTIDGASAVGIQPAENDLISTSCSSPGSVDLYWSVAVTPNSCYVITSPDDVTMTMFEPICGERTTEIGCQPGGLLVRTSRNTINLVISADESGMYEMNVREVDCEDEEPAGI